MFVATYIDADGIRRKVDVPVGNEAQVVRWMRHNHPGVHMFHLRRARRKPRNYARIMSAVVAAMDETGMGAHRPPRRR